MSTIKKAQKGLRLSEKRVLREKARAGDLPSAIQDSANVSKYSIKLPGDKKVLEAPARIRKGQPAYPPKSKCGSKIKKKGK